MRDDLNISLTYKEAALPNVGEELDKNSEWMSYKQACPIGGDKENQCDSSTC